MIRTKPVTCFECNGTGADQPDCWLCRGKMFISVHKARREGYSADDIEDYKGSCRCPADECRGDSCEWCDGAATVDPGLFEREVTRVLICAGLGHIPETPVRFHGGWRRSSRLLLSPAAGRYCKKQGWIGWWRSMFGDDISLTDAGRHEFDRRHPAWVAQFDCDWRPYDEDGRFADDGGASSASSQNRGAQ